MRFPVWKLSHSFVRQTYVRFAWTDLFVKCICIVLRMSRCCRIKRSFQHCLTQNWYWEEAGYGRNMSVKNVVKFQIPFPMMHYFPSYKT